MYACLLAVLLFFRLVLNSSLSDKQAIDAPDNDSKNIVFYRCGTASHAHPRTITSAAFLSMTLLREVIIIGRKILCKCLWRK